MHGCVSHINLINYYFGKHNDSINMQQFVYSFNKVCIFHFHYGPLLSIQKVHYNRYVPVQSNIQLFCLFGVVHETVMLTFLALKMRDYHPLQQNIENEYHPLQQNIENEYHPLQQKIENEYHPLQQNIENEYHPLQQCIENHSLSKLHFAGHSEQMSIIH